MPNKDSDEVSKALATAAKSKKVRPEKPGYADPRMVKTVTGLAKAGFKRDAIAAGALAAREAGSLSAYGYKSALSALPAK